MKECKEEGCNERNYSLGMCKTHYRRFDYYRSRGTTKKMWPKICTADGCEKKAILKGFCNAHYLRNKRLGSPNVPKKYAPPGSGHTTPDGYRKIYVEKRGVMEHRYVME